MRLIVPYPPGGGIDIAARLLAHKLTGTLMSALPFVKASWLKALGVTSMRRSQVAPDIPAISETLPGYDFSNWHSVLAPRGTPPKVPSRW